MKLYPLNRKPVVSASIAFLTIIGFWVFYLVVISIRAAAMDFPDQLELATRRIGVAVLGCAVTWLYYLFLTLFDRKPLGYKIAAAFIAAVPAAIAIAWANHVVFNVFDPMSIFEDPEIAKTVDAIQAKIGYSVWQDILESGIILYYFQIAWASLYLALGYAQEVREAERATARFAQAAQDAELRSLRYQVNPHFLFNTLNSLSSLVITGKNAAAEEMIQNLSNFYRNSLSLDPLEDGTLDEEVELQKRYLGIETVRYPKRLRTEFQIDEAVRNFKVPTMILQPLVENAIKYGVARTNRPVTVSIHARAIEGGVEFIVADDGEETTGASSAPQHGAGIGLANVRDRLEARFGPRARLDTQKRAGGGFIAKITIMAENDNGG
jgi:two-component system, LytTR family, sensor kinase